MAKILSLAIPAYNMERLIARCLDSVALKEFNNDLEILLINDGSKDNTLDIMRKYASEYVELIRLINKPNGGWGSAINLAMKEATGKYFKILDSDDWFQKEAFSSFIQVLKTSDEDLIATSYSKVYDELAPEYIELPYQDGRVYTFEALLQEHQFNSFLPMATLCFKTSILKDITVSDRYYADVEYALYPLAKVNTVKFCNCNLYQYYLIGNEHSTSQLGYKRHFNDYIEMTHKLINFYNKKNHNGIHKQLLQNEISKQVRFGYYLLMSPTFNGSAKDYKSTLKQYNQKIKETSSYFYKTAIKATVKGCVPFIGIWRVSGLNILNWRLWL